MLTFPPRNRDDVVGKRTSVLFGHSTHMRFASIAAFLARYSPSHFDYYERHTPLHFLQTLIRTMETARLGVSKVTSPGLWRIDNLLKPGSTMAFGTKVTQLRKPKVVVNTTLNRRGGISVMWHPNPKEFIAEDLDYRPSYSGRPQNEFLYFKEFAEYADGVRDDTLEPWERAMYGHILHTCKLAFDEVQKEVQEYCEVKVAARLCLIRDSQDMVVDWEVIDEPEIEARADAERRRSRTATLQRVRKDLAAVSDALGIPWADFVGHVDEMRIKKMTYARIEDYLVGTLGMKPLERNETIQRVAARIKNLVAERDKLAEMLGLDP
jgi:hypothetical protein